MSYKTKQTIDSDLSFIEELVDEIGRPKKSGLLLSIREAAAILRIKPLTLYRWGYMGKLNYSRIGKALRITPEEICFADFVSSRPNNARTRLKFCASIYDIYLRKYPEKEDMFQNMIKPYLPEIWKYYADRFNQKRKK